MATIKGTIITDFGSYDKGLKVFVQDNGKITVLGTTSGLSGDDLAIARYNSNGSLDSSFSSDGKLTATATMTTNDVTLLADGKFLTAGKSANAIALARYTTEGSLDGSFDGDGMLTTTTYNSGYADYVNDVAVQADGKLVAVGYSSAYAAWAILRYNSNGSLDTSFNTDGISLDVSTYGGAAASVAVQPDGKAIVGGMASDNFLLARLTREGLLDTTFGGGTGKVSVDLGGKDSIKQVTVLSNGKILAVGMSDDKIALTRYNLDGTLDTSFDTDGKVVGDASGATLNDIVVQADGKILGVGTDSNYDIVLVRYNSNGILDSSFNSIGKVVTDLGGSEEGNSLAVQKDGRILVAGSSDIDVALVRYNKDGSLDSSFSGTGSGTGTVDNPDTNTDPDPTDPVITNPNGKAGFVFNAVKGITATAETGGQVTYNVSLNSQPLRDVSISFKSSNSNEGMIQSGSTLKFTHDNWNVAQQLVVKGVDDKADDGDTSYQLNATVSSIDINYKLLSVSPLKLINSDNDAALPATEIYGDKQGSSSDLITGTDAPNTIYGLNMADDMSGGLGNDILWGGYGQDNLFGEDGNDLLQGEQDADYMDGGAGNDTLDGGQGADEMIGGAGNDTYILGYDAKDIIHDDGLAGDTDTVIMPYQIKNYTLAQGIENGVIAAGTAEANLTGNTGNNSLTGNAGNNSLNGSTGNDTLSGGAGRDSFVFNSTLKANLDKITDFSPKFDRIQLDDAVFKSLHTGVLTASAFNTGGATDGSDRIIYNKTTGALFYDDDGAGAHAAVQIALVGANLALTAASFSVI